MKQKQNKREVIWKQIARKGYVSRNWCLGIFYTRMASLATKLRYEGVRIGGYWGYQITNKGGKDFYYVLEDFIKHNKDGTITLINTK